jgi:hypothetical protein
MISLQEAVREEPIYSEAKLVADETMKRVRKNVEVLSERLAEIKFFDPYDGRKLPAFVPPPADVKEALDKLEKTIGILPISMRSFCEQVGSVNFFGSMKKSTGIKCTYPDPLFVDLLRYVWADYDEWEVEWFEGCNPLCATIAPDKYHKADVSGGSPYRIMIPNLCADGFVFSDESQDLMFVDYLRMCFRCGGLPGLKVEHRAFADKLSKGLIPF